MLTFIIVFLIMFVITFVLGFINELTGGGVKWMFIIGLVLAGMFIISNLGAGLGSLVIVGIILLVIRSIWGLFKGAISGILSIFM